MKLTSIHEAECSISMPGLSKRGLIDFQVITEYRVFTDDFTSSWLTPQILWSTCFWFDCDACTV